MTEQIRFVTVHCHNAGNLWCGPDDPS